jgi:hypothetical protein
MQKERASARRANGGYLEYSSYVIARDIYQTLHASGLNQFTYSWVEAVWEELTALVYELECHPETALPELQEVIERLTEARNELRLARFLFDVEEVNPLYRLIMRNRAVLRGKACLHRGIEVWPRMP